MATIKKKPKTKTKKKMAPIAKLVCAVLVCVSAYLLFALVKEGLTTVRLKKELADIQAKYTEVQEENQKLTEQKAKLQDPDYVESYARSNYNLSKEGEQIFYLPEDTAK